MNRNGLRWRDAPRDSATHILFQENVDNANYNVGVWSAAYGMTEAEMHLLGISYIVKNSDNNSEALSTYTRDAPLWEQGYVDYNRGYINK